MKGWTCFNMIAQPDRDIALFLASAKMLVLTTSENLLLLSIAELHLLNENWREKFVVFEARASGGSREHELLLCAN